MFLPIVKDPIQNPDVKVPHAYVSLELVNFPVADGTQLSWVGNFPKKIWILGSHPFTIHGGSGSYGLEVPILITADKFYFSLTNTTNWYRNWYEKNVHMGTVNDYSDYVNWVVPVKLDGRYHPLVLDGSTATIQIRDKSQALQPYSNGKPAPYNLECPSKDPFETFSTTSLSIKNEGNEVITLDTTFTTSGEDSPFSISSSLPAMVIPGESFNIDIKFQPTEPLYYEGDVIFKNALGGQEIKIFLSGDNRITRYQPPESVGIFGSSTGNEIHEKFSLTKLVTGVSKHFFAITYLYTGELKFRGTTATDSFQIGRDSTLYNGHYHPPIHAKSIPGIPITTEGFYLVSINYDMRNFLVEPMGNLNIVTKDTGGGGNSISLSGDPETDEYTGLLNPIDPTKLSKLYIENDDFDFMNVFRFGDYNADGICDRWDTLAFPPTQDAYVLKFNGRTLAYSYTLQ